MSQSVITVSKFYILIALTVIVYLIINIFFANRWELSVYGYIKLSELVFLAYYIAKTINSRNQFVLISIYFSVGLLFESSLAILQYINQGSLNGLFYFFGERTFTGVTPGIANASINGTLILRPYATFPHPNVLAAYLLVAMVLVWMFLVKNKETYLQMLGAVSVFIGSISLLLTFSRVVILLWVFLALLVLVRSLTGRIITVRTKIIVLVIFFLCGFGIVFLHFTHEVFNRLIQSSFTDESVTERLELLTTSWKMIAMRPLIGVGLDNFIPSLAPLQKPMPLGLYLQPVHNILFLWLSVVTLYTVRNQSKMMSGMLFLLLLIIVITGMFDHYWLTLQQGQLLFATIIGFCWAKIKKVSLQ